MTVVSTLLSGGTALIAVLSQTRTNGTSSDSLQFECLLEALHGEVFCLHVALGESKWGTLQAPKWPHFLTNNVRPHTTYIKSLLIFLACGEWIPMGNQKHVQFRPL